MNFNHFNESNTIAFQSSTSSCTYKELGDKINQYSKLFNSLFLPQQKKIGLAIKDPLMHIIATWGLWQSGKTVVLIPPFSNKLQLNTYLDVVPIDKILTDQHNDLLSTLPILTAINSLSNSTGKSDERPIKLSPPKIALIVFTSGSSGPPKGVAHSLAAILKSASSTLNFYSIKQTICWGLCLPLYHIGGFMIPIRMLLLGGSIKQILLSDSAMQSDYISLVPTQLKRLLQLKHYPLNQDCHIVLGGGSIDSDLKDEALKQKLNISLTFGQSEACSQITATQFNDDIFRRDGIAGSVLPHMQLKLNQSHLILIKSESIMLGQYRQHTFHPVTLDQQGFYQTQDRGRLIDQKLIIKMRNDLIFISGGENISPVEIENIINKKFNFNFNLVVPVPHEEYGHSPFVFYQTSKKILPTTIIHTLSQHLTKYKRPKYYYPLFEHENFSDSNSFKPSRYKLQQKALTILADATAMQTDILQQAICSGNPAAPPLIFFHGMMGLPSSWAAVIQQLQANHYCLALPLPGHGNFHIKQSNFRALYFQALANIINAFSQKVILIGYSMGGRIILEKLKYNSSNIKCCILESSSFGLNEQQDKQQRLLTDYKLFQSINNTKQFHAFLQNWYQAEIFAEIKLKHDFPQLISSLLARQNELGQWQKCLDEFSVAKQDHFEDYIDLLNFDIHYISGKKDQKYNDAGKEYSAKYRNLKHYSVNNCGHNTHFEQCDYFIEILRQIF